MITLVAGGGLGNQLFQYGAVRRLCRSLGVGMEIDTRYYPPALAGTSMAFYLDRLPIKAKIRRYPRSGVFSAHSIPRRVFRKVWEKRRPGYREAKLGFDPAFFDIPADAVVHGNFQSYKYLAPRDPETDAELDLSKFLPHDMTGDAEKIRASRPTSIHVRRGDYVGNPNFEMPDYFSYLTRAMDFSKSANPNTKFLVFSDDIPWCRTFPAFQDGCEFFVTEHGPSNPGAEMYLMSLCESHIISNSTFSWWAAWSGDRPCKLVIAPRKWIHGLTITDMDLLPPHWRAL